MIAGRYTLDREIGRGGMGAVWLGRDEVLGRVVAIKRIGITPGDAGRGGFGAELQRAEREARLAARLNHRHVVSVFDLVGEGDERWLVMEYVEGTNLSALLREHGAMEPEAAGRVLHQAADALSAAHASGIVHRDVKPSNLLVGIDGTVKLSDFGIARAQSDDSLTLTGVVTGSPAYLAPEVASGSSATAASDVWSLGATAFHAVTGRPAYDVGDNLLGALYRIVHEEPPQPAAPGWLGPMIAATMVRDPARRWSMDQVRDVLAAGPQSAQVISLRGGRSHSATTTTDRAAEPTALIPTVPPPPTPTTAPTSPTGTPLDPTPAGPRGPDRRRVWPALLVAATLLVVIALAALAVGLKHGATDPSSRPSQPLTTSSPAAPRSSTPPAKVATAAGMTRFVGRYLSIASTDHEAGFQLLTPQFQQLSGGLSGYESFWDRVTRVVGHDQVRADPSTLVVSYRYVYLLRPLAGGRPSQTTERVTLQLAYDAASDSYRIAGAL